MEIVLFGITAFIVINMYYDWKYMKMALSYQKYWKMVLVVLGALVLYFLLKYNPQRAKEMIHASNEYIKYLPLDKNTSDFITPILDFTNKQNFYEQQWGGGGGGGGGENSGSSHHPVLSMVSSGETKMMNSGKRATKRSVSETKKKFVASRQNWKCGDCNQQLNAWFEIDHKVRLEHGGSNHVDNLVALCRECHGKKTTIENL